MAKFLHNCLDPDCGKEYEAKRSTSKFCSASCRVRYNRRNHNSVNVAVEMMTAIDSLKLLKKASGKELLSQSPLFEEMRILFLEVDMKIGEEIANIK